MVKVYTKWDQLTLHFVNLISFLAIAGSLYYSDIVGIEPCVLCWYQRIFLYPIFIITFVGIVRKDVSSLIYAFILALFAWPISIYQYLGQKTDWFGTESTCGGDVACNAVNIDYLGFITIPFLSFVAISLVLLSSAALYLYRRKNLKEKN